MTINVFNLPHPLVCFQFTIANISAGTAPVDGILAGGNGCNGPIVPTGYKFVPFHIDVESNDARTAGSSIIKVTSGGTELAGGPEATLAGAPATLRASGTVTGAPTSVAAAAEVGVSASGDGSFAPTTADADVILYGYFLPA
jgi:hypothetical protein